jgi:hypothetical protein
LLRSRCPCYIEDLAESTHFLDLFKEEPGRLFEILERFLSPATAGRQVEFARCATRRSGLLEDLGGKLNCHILLGFVVGCAGSIRSPRKPVKRRAPEALQQSRLFRQAKIHEQMPTNGRTS